MISSFVENKIIIELLLEGGFNPFDKACHVEYLFEEISLETRIKKENHELNKYQSNAQTFTETRRRIGMKDESDDDEQLFNRKVTDESALRSIDRTAEHQKELAYINGEIAAKAAAAKPSSGSSSSNNKSSGTSVSSKKTRSTKDKGPNGTVKSLDRPSNQHGTYSVKVKE
jgi:hypothetical protein